MDTFVIINSIIIMNAKTHFYPAKLHPYLRSLVKVCLDKDTPFEFSDYMHTDEGTFVSNMVFHVLPENGVEVKVDRTGKIETKFFDGDCRVVSTREWQCIDDVIHYITDFE